MLSSTRGLLASPDFRLLFAGQAASALGDRIALVALAIYVTQRTGSASDVGVVLAAQALPLVALLLIGGVWADRLPRQRVMLAADAVRGVLHSLLAALILAGSPPVAVIAVIEIGFGAAMAFFQPAYTGLLPQTVAPERVQAARALTELAYNVAFLAGPALATVLVLTAGAGAALAIDAATFGVSAVCLARVTPRSGRSAAADSRSAESGTAAADPRSPESGAAGVDPRSPESGAAGVDPQTAGVSMLADLREGWREVRSRPWVWASIAAFSVVVFSVYAPWYALGPTAARDVYGRVSTFGWLETGYGVGAVTGGLLALRLRPARPLAVGLVLALAWPLENGLLALGAPLTATLAGGVAGGAGFSVLIVMWETALAEHIPPTVLSRVSAYDWMVSLGLNPLGYVVAGPLAVLLGVRTVLGAGCVLGVLAVLASLLPRSTRGLRLARLQPSSESARSR